MEEIGFWQIRSSMAHWGDGLSVSSCFWRTSFQFVCLLVFCWGDKIENTRWPQQVTRLVAKKSYFPSASKHRLPQYKRMKQRYLVEWLVRMYILVYISKYIHYIYTLYIYIYTHTYIYWVGFVFFMTVVMTSVWGLNIFFFFIMTICQKVCNHSSGAVWESRWMSWAVRPNEPSGFSGRKELLNCASALVTTCP